MTNLARVFPRRSWYAVALAVLLVTSARLPAQTKADPEDFMKDVIKALFGPNWNLFVSGGATTNGQFLLQRPNLALPAERELTTNTGYNVGIGGGVDILLRTGIRLGYTYSNNNLRFRTNTGDGSDNLDVDDAGTLGSHTIAAEVVRYMLPARAMVTPYASIGFQGTWWTLDNGFPILDPAGGSTQFRLGGLVTFGVQAKMGDHFGARLEATAASTGNPFSGRHSFRAVTGTTIDEPTKVSHTDYRVGGVYYFGKPKMPAPPTMATKNDSKQ